MPVSMKIFYILAVTESVFFISGLHVDIRVILSSVLFTCQHTLFYHIQVL